MADKNQLDIDVSVGAQDFLDIRRKESPAVGYEVRVLDPDKADLYAFESEDIRDKTSIVVLLAQKLSQDREFGYGRDQLPYRWAGNRWVSVERWMTSVDYSMHALIRTAINRRMTSDSLSFETLSAWQANSKYPLDGLDLRAFGNCPGIPFRDKVLKLSKSGWVCIPHAPEHFNTRFLDLDADDAGARYIEVSLGNHDDSMLMQFLRSTLDEAQQVVFRRWLGYHLLVSRLPNAEKMLYLWGSGANGKSQLLWLIRSLVGTDACAELRLPDIRVSANIEKLVGKLAMIGSEATTTTDLETLKSLISREPLNCNPKYRDPFTVVPECLVSQASNEAPEFGEKSDAMVRRTIALHLKNSFLNDGTRKEDIAQRIIESEYPLLVGLALWGAEELISAGRFILPDGIAESSKAAVVGGHQISDFSELLEFGAYEIALPELYAAYVRWCKDEGRNRSAMNSRNMLLEIERYAVTHKKTIHVQKKAVHYEPQHWQDDNGHRTPVSQKVKAMTRVDILCGLRISADAFGSAIGQEMLTTRQCAHLFSALPAQEAIPVSELVSA